MMYLNHFGMQQAPFGLTPNTAFYVDLPTHQQAMEVLQVALAQGEGFIKVTGEVGTGKTLLCRKLLQEAPEHWALAYLPDPNASPLELKWALALELGLKQSANIDGPQLSQLLQRQLMLLAAQQKQVVLLIDEAQALPDDTLEALRLLTNLETEQRKLLQVVLFGQPELDRRLASYQFRQLRQRISFSYQLAVLDRQQVQCYLQARLQVAGVTKPLFRPLAIWALWHYSRGIPRLLNILAHKALMLGYGKGLASIGLPQVWRAVQDTEDARPMTIWWPWLAAMILLAWWCLPPGVL
jgi:MSHA biogenesis protein MshM